MPGDFKKSSVDYLLLDNQQLAEDSDYSEEIIESEYLSNLDDMRLKEQNCYNKIITYKDSIKHRHPPNTNQFEHLVKEFNKAWNCAMIALCELPTNEEVKNMLDILRAHKQTVTNFLDEEKEIILLRKEDKCYKEIIELHRLFALSFVHIYDEYESLTQDFNYSSKDVLEMAIDHLTFHFRDNLFGKMTEHEEVWKKAISSLCEFPKDLILNEFLKTLKEHKESTATMLSEEKHAFEIMSYYKKKVKDHEEMNRNNGIKRIRSDNGNELPLNNFISMSIVDSPISPSDKAHSLLSPQEPVIANQTVNVELSQKIKKQCNR
ncbi:MAG: hypothetical protein JWM09_664 [Francisellaceae bacterium]|nr:hypothetical protein [Francisellaceae bacterium]